MPHIPCIPYTMSMSMYHIYTCRRWRRWRRYGETRSWPSGGSRYAATSSRRTRWPPLTLALTLILTPTLSLTPTPALTLNLTPTRYKMVKDLRTQHETSQVQDVLTLTLSLTPALTAR